MAGMWDTIKAGWKGFTNKVKEYIPHIPHALLMSGLVLGGMILLGPHLPPGVNDFLNIAALKRPEVFAGRLALTVGVGIALSGGLGAFEEISKLTGGPALPLPAPAAAPGKTAPDIAPGKEPEIVLPPGLPPKTAALGKSSRQPIMQDTRQI